MFRLKFSLIIKCSLIIENDLIWNPWSVVNVMSIMYVLRIKCCQRKYVSVQSYQHSFSEGRISFKPVYNCHWVTY